MRLFAARGARRPRAGRSPSRAYRCPPARRTADSAPSAPTTSAGAELAPVAEADPRPHRASSRASRNRRASSTTPRASARAVSAAWMRPVLADVPEVRLAELGGIEHERIRTGRHPGAPPRSPCAGRRAARAATAGQAPVRSRSCCDARESADTRRSSGAPAAGAVAGRGSTSAMRRPRGRGRRREERGRAGACHCAADDHDVEVALHAASDSRLRAADRAPAAVAGRRVPWCGARTRA